MNVIDFLKLNLRNKMKVAQGNHVSIDASAKIRGCKIIVKGRNNHLRIAKGCNLRNVHIEILGNNCSITIDEGCVIGENCYLSSREEGTRLALGADCMLSRNVKLMTSDGHDILKAGQRVNFAKDITLGCSVWLADNVTVLKGVTIGEGSIVGINSTLTKSIANNEVAAGSPAKVVASDMSWHEALTF